MSDSKPIFDFLISESLVWQTRWEATNHQSSYKAFHKHSNNSLLHFFRNLRMLNYCLMFASISCQTLTHLPPFEGPSSHTVVCGLGREMMSQFSPKCGQIEVKIISMRHQKLLFFITDLYLALKCTLCTYTKYFICLSDSNSLSYV